MINDAAFYTVLALLMIAVPMVAHLAFERDRLAVKANLEKSRADNYAALIHLMIQDAEREGGR